MDCIGSSEDMSFDGVTRACALLMLIAGAVAPDIAPGKLPKADPDLGAIGTLGVAAETDGGFAPKRDPPVVNLGSSVDGASVLGSGFGIRLNAPGWIPANRLGTVIAGAGIVALSSAVDLVSSSVGAAPSENPVKSSVCANTVEGFSLTATPFGVSSGGVIGVATADEVEGALTVWSSKGSTLAEGGGIDLASAAGDEEGDTLEETVSHCPNGVFGDAGRGLCEDGFSPLTSSSSPPDTGVFARGELRSGRVLGLPRPTLELGDGVSEGDGSVGIGC
jgi:hypothetical protein